MKEHDEGMAQTLRHKSIFTKWRNRKVVRGMMNVNTRF